MFRFIILGASLFFIAACSTIPPVAPENKPAVLQMPTVEPSIISMPIVLDLELVRASVFKNAPNPLASGQETMVMKIKRQTEDKVAGKNCDGISVSCIVNKASQALSFDYTVPAETEITYQVFLRDFKMTVIGNKFTVVNDLDFTLNAKFKSNLTEFGLASCGIYETMPRIELTLKGTIAWAENGDLVLTPEPYAMRWKSPCNITAFDFNVETLLQMPGIRDTVNQQVDDAIMSNSKAMSLRSQLKRYWNDINQPREVQPDLWLVPHVEKISFAEPLGNGRYVKAGVVLQANPKIVSGKKPTIVIPPMPNPEKALVGDKFSVSLLGDVGVIEAENYINKSVTGKNLNSSSNPLIIEKVRLYGNDDKAVIGLSLKAPVKAEVFLKGKLVFNSVTNTVTFEDLDYSLESAGFLVKTASWLLTDTIKSKLRDAAKFRFDEDLKDQLKSFQNYKQEIIPGLSLKLNLLRVRPQALYFSGDRIVSYVISEGNVQLETSEIK